LGFYKKTKSGTWAEGFWKIKKKKRLGSGNTKVGEKRKKKRLYVREGKNQPKPRGGRGNGGLGGVAFMKDFMKGQQRVLIQVRWIAAAPSSGGQ